jgi:hypothetical protein
VFTPKGRPTLHGIINHARYCFHWLHSDDNRDGALC